MLGSKKKLLYIVLIYFFFFLQIASRSEITYIGCLLALNGCHSADKYRLLIGAI